MFWLVVLFLILLAIALIFDIGWLKVALAVIVLICAICVMPGIAGMLGTAFPAFGVAVGGGSWLAAGLLIVGSYLIDPSVVDKVIEATGEIVEKVVEVGAGVIGSLLGTFFSSPMGIAVLAFGAVLLYTKLSSNDNDGSESNVFDAPSNIELDSEQGAISA